MLRSIVGTLIALSLAASASALDHVTFTRDGRQLKIDGRVLVEARDGGLLFEARDGVLWAVTPDELIEHTRDKQPFEPYPPQEFQHRLLAELPRGFNVHTTAHYTIFYNTSKTYAGWCGSLFERLYMAFTNYFERKGFDIEDPEFPLVAVVFADRASYAEHSQPVLGEAAASVIGYFNLRDNRMTMYDLTGVDAAARRFGGINSVLKINRYILAQPEAVRQVSTVVHEATHQIAFNCGMHQRYSDAPVWLSEGIAMYFETPDLGSSRGWRGIGQVNRPRLRQFRKYTGSRPADSLKTLIESDARFRDTSTAPDAYAEAWALTYYLIRQESAKFVTYLKGMADKGPLLEDEPEERLREFEDVFGSWSKVDDDMTQYILDLR